MIILSLLFSLLIGTGIGAMSCQKLTQSTPQISAAPGKFQYALKVYQGTTCHESDQNGPSVTYRSVIVQLTNQRTGESIQRSTKFTFEPNETKSKFQSLEKIIASNEKTMKTMFVFFQTAIQQCLKKRFNECATDAELYELSKGNKLYLLNEADFSAKQKDSTVFNILLQQSKAMTQPGTGYQPLAETPAASIVRWTTKNQKKDPACCSIQ